ncbi:MAG: hypothetical protein SAK29_01250 [Scytonema sp. PMC 1069.18]|nr:hypothetical protein [Scytonema sp. PMC 1069.18]MEC4811901.1 hypothetical protein [Scytonema sp. PMC 1069.18]MEC4884996.1 hypothetical protein [Scytonema sp. PMC 1070.18]
MNQDYQDKNQNAPSNFDEDDEFGGAKLTVELFYRNRKNKSKATPTTVLEVDEDDEFGGAKLTPELIYRNRSTTPKTSTPTVETDEDDEFGGVKLTVDQILGRKPAKVETEDNAVIDEDEPLYTCQYKIFSPIIPTNQWYVDREELTDSVTSTYHSVTIPIVIDTEFTDKSKKEYQQKSRLGLTTQICGIASDAPKTIFAHTERVNAGRMMAGVKPMTMFESDFHPVDYLNSLGLEVEIWEATETELAEIPKCFVVLYGHFLTAEINMIASGTVKEKIKALQRSQGEEQISSGRRAYCQTTVDGQKLDWVSLKHVISINGYCYELCLKLVDTGAIHGVASYKDFCSAVGWKLQYKDNFTSEEKAKMLDMAIERFRDFENYALGDLEVYEALNSYYEQWKIVYEKLGLADYFQCPKLTIGGTVKDLFEAALAKTLEISALDEDNSPVWREELNLVIEQFIKPASANDLRQFSTHTRALLAKVEGGRCRNNRPTDIFIRRQIKGKYDAALICDIDISGCYGEGQRNQSYFLGIPEIFDYKATKNNDYITLRDWLKAYDVNVDQLIKSVNEKDLTAWKNPDNWGELLPGAWYARISTRERLKYPQDYFASWFTESVDRVDLLAKSIRNMKSDTEMVSTDWVDFDEECGSLKIFNHEIWNAVLTHDGLQWILAICSPRQRNELLDKIQILASAVYPRSQRITINSPKEALETLKTTYNNWSGRNTTERVKINGRSKIVMNFDECHAWFDINLGDLLVNNLLIERKKSQKVYGKKSPLDVLFKLCVNTLYGDMVSKYFITSNPVVGNNITARARCLAWLMEKGLHGWQSITDGCAFELNGVMFPKNKNISGESINQHRQKSELKQRNLTRSPLANAQEILAYWEDSKLTLVVDSVEIENPTDWIDVNAMCHLQNLFPLIDVLHNESTIIKIDEELNVSFKPRLGQFSFETKDVYWCGAFHGSANYLLANPNGTTIKARGYEVKKAHSAVDGETVAEGDEVVFMKSERYGAKNNPAKDLMNQLLENPKSVKRQLPAIKSGILKISDYKNLADKYDKLGIEPGDGILRTFLLQEFSLSQFTFQTYEQYMMWKKIISHLKDTDRQSLEGFFLNDDGTLDFIKLCNWVDEQIAEGVDKPFDLLTDPNRNDRRAEKRAKQADKVGKQRGGGKKKKRKVISLSHPQLETFNALRSQLKDSDLAEVPAED